VAVDLPVDALDPGAEEGRIAPIRRLRQPTSTEDPSSYVP